MSIFNNLFNAKFSSKTDQFPFLFLPINTWSGYSISILQKQWQMKGNTDWLSGDISVIPRCLLSLGKPEKIGMIELFEYSNFLFWISPGDPTPPLTSVRRSLYMYKKCFTVHRKTKKSYRYVTFGIFESSRVLVEMTGSDWVLFIRNPLFCVCGFSRQ